MYYHGMWANLATASAELTSRFFNEFLMALGIH